MTLYPFNEHRVQANADHCPAPWCGISLVRELPRFVAVTFERDMWQAFDPSPPDLPSCMYRLKTCRRGACIEWARLRAEDLRGGPGVDPVYVAYLWARNPGPMPPEEMRRERFERNLRESIDRIQDRLRLRPIT